MEEPVAVPEQIEGQNVVDSGGAAGMNCLIHAILGATGIEDVDETAVDVREFLVQQGIADYNEMLDLAGEAGPLVIAYLRSVHLIAAERGIRAYYHQGGQLHPQNIAGGDNPIKLYLSFAEGHFYSIVDN